MAETVTNAARVGGHLPLYNSPKLTSYGSVRNLTGGSANRGNDGALGMTMNP